MGWTRRRRSVSCHESVTSGYAPSGEYMIIQIRIFNSIPWVRQEAAWGEGAGMSCEWSRPPFHFLNGRGAHRLQKRRRLSLYLL